MQIHRIQSIVLLSKDDPGRYDITHRTGKFSGNRHSGYQDEESGTANSPPEKPVVSESDDVDFYA